MQPTLTVDLDQIGPTPDQQAVILEELIEFKQLYKLGVRRADATTETLAHVIELYQKPRTQFVYQSLFSKGRAGNSETREFGPQALAFLIERRMLIICKGNIYLNFGLVPQPINSQRSNDMLKAAFGLKQLDIKNFHGSLACLRVMATIDDPESTNLLTPTFPSHFRESVRGYCDKMVDLSTATLSDVDPKVIPGRRFTSSWDDVNEDDLAAADELLWRIADYNPDMRQRLCKMIMFGHTHTCLENIFVMLGSGRNGKTLFNYFVEAAYGAGQAFKTSNYADVIQGNSSTRESVMQSIVTSKIVFFEDEPKLSAKVFDNLKNLASGGTSLTRRLGENAEQIKNEAVFYVATNSTNFSDVATDNYAFRDRTVFVDFTNKFIKDDPRTGDSELLNRIFTDHGCILTSQLVLHIVLKEIGHLSRSEINRIPSDTTAYNKYAGHGEAEFDVDETFCRLIAGIETHPEWNLAKTKTKIRLDTVKQYLGISTAQLNKLVGEPLDTGLTVRKSSYMCLVVNMDQARKHMDTLGPVDVEQAEYVSKLKPDHLAQLCPDIVRVSWLKHQLGLDDVAKDDFAEQLSHLSYATVELIDGQPFVKVEPYVEVDPFAALLDELATEDDEEDFELTDDFTLSVFDIGRYPRNGEPVSSYTDNPADVVSPAGVSKEATVKLFPYYLKTRGKDSNARPSNWLAMDFDSPASGDSIDVVLKELKEYGFECWLQESPTSNTHGYVKFHLLVACDDKITEANYADAVELFDLALPFKHDPQYRYHSILNCSSYPWHKIEGALFLPPEPAVNSGERDCPVNLEADPTWGENFDTLDDYLMHATPHATAQLFCEIRLLGTYDFGARDETVSKICLFLNSCLESWGMKPKVYKEGYDSIRSIVANHPRLEGKSALLHKITRWEIEV